jgi:hypothetical protein
LSACVILAEIGRDMSRFPTAGHLISWAGLCPKNDESAGKRRSTRMRKGAPWLKTTLVQCAAAAARKKASYLQAQFHRLRARRGAKKALGALAASSRVFKTSATPFKSPLWRHDPGFCFSLGRNIFPVPMRRELRRKPLNILRQLRTNSRTRRLRRTEFPVFGRQMGPGGSHLRPEYREFCSSGPASGSQSRNKFNALRRNSLRIGTGNLFRPSRELNPGHQGSYSPDQGIPHWPPFHCGVKEYSIIRAHEQRTPVGTEGSAPAPSSKRVTISVREARGDGHPRRFEKAVGSRGAPRQQVG